MAHLLAQCVHLALLFGDSLQSADAPAEALVGGADRLGRRAARRSVEEIAQRLRSILADAENAETVSMPEFERRIARAQLFPEPMDTEAVRIFGSVVKQGDATLR